MSETSNSCCSAELIDVFQGSDKILGLMIVFFIRVINVLKASCNLASINHHHALLTLSPPTFLNWMVSQNKMEKFIHFNQMIT